MLVVVGCIGLAACGGGSPAPTYPPLTGAHTVSVGDSNACAAMEDGTAVCWGLQAFGALGDGTSEVRPGPVAATGLAGVKSIETGDSQSCAIDGAGLVWCWGSNGFGQLANGTSSFGDNPTPSPTTENSGPMAALGAGSAHALCGVLASGAVECWGADVFGLAPAGSSAVFIAPTPLPGLTEARAVALGDFFGCALHADGTVSCWGSGALGQPDPSGTNPLSSSATPIRVAGVTGAVEIAAGRYHACARLADGDVWCWGSVGFGPQRSGTPVRVEALSGAVSLAAGDQVTCAVLTSGAVRCVGLIGAANDTVPGVARATSLSVGKGTACAVIADGTIKCWGRRAGGLLGDGRWDAGDESHVAVTVIAPGSARLPP